MPKVLSRRTAHSTREDSARRAPWRMRFPWRTVRGVGSLGTAVVVDTDAVGDGNGDTLWEAFVVDTFVEWDGDGRFCAPRDAMLSLATRSSTRVREAEFIHYFLRAMRDALAPRPRLRPPLDSVDAFSMGSSMERGLQGYA